MCMPLKTVFSRHEGDGVQITDEPTGNLDSRTSQDVMAFLKAGNQRFQQTMVMITHNPEIAQMADRIIRIEDGRIKSGGAGQWGSSRIGSIGAEQLEPVRISRQPEPAGSARPSSGKEAHTHVSGEK